jgi:hypothetical protein
VESPEFLLQYHENKKGKKEKVFEKIQHSRSRKCGTYTIEFYSARRIIDMWVEGKWMQLEDIILSEVSQIQKDKGQLFLSYMEDKHAHKNNHYHIQTHI